MFFYSIHRGLVAKLNSLFSQVAQTADWVPVCGENNLQEKIFEENAVTANIDAFQGSHLSVLCNSSENEASTEDNSQLSNVESLNEPKMILENETTETGAKDDNETKLESINSVKKSRKVGTYESNDLISSQPDDSKFDSAKYHTDEETPVTVQPFNKVVIPDKAKLNDKSKAPLKTKIPQKSKRMDNGRYLGSAQHSPYHDSGNSPEIYRESEQILGKCFAKEDSFRNVLIEKLDLCNQVCSSENYGGGEFCQEDLDESDCVSELDCSMSEYNSPISRKHSRIPRINRSNSLMSFKRRCSLQSLPHHSSRRSSISSRRSSTLSIDERPPWNYGAGGTPYQKMYPFGKKRLSVDNYYD